MKWKFAFVLLAGLVSSTGRADNPRCVGSPDRYEGSKNGCPDARAPKESKWKGEKPKKGEPAPAQPARDQMPQVLKL